jgi:hypothetical protein
MLRRAAADNDTRWHLRITPRLVAHLDDGEIRRINTNPTADQHASIILANPGGPITRGAVVFQTAGLIYHATPPPNPHTKPGPVYAQLLCITTKPDPPNPVIAAIAQDIQGDWWDCAPTIPRPLAPIPPPTATSHQLATWVLTHQQ